MVTDCRPASGRDGGRTNPPKGLETIFTVAVDRHLGRRLCVVRAPPKQKNDNNNNRTKELDGMSPLYQLTWTGLDVIQVVMNKKED
jgi:hypothetical protein